MPKKRSSKLMEFLKKQFPTTARRWHQYSVHLLRVSGTKVPGSPDSKEFASKWEIPDQSLSQEDPLEKRMVIYARILA